MVSDPTRPRLPAVRPIRQAKANRAGRKRRGLLLGVIGGMAVLVGWGLYRGDSSAPTKNRALPSNVLPIEGGEHDDASRRRLIVGTWQDDYQGKRTMTLAEDGTGTMLVELDGWKASLFASRLRFDMQWSVVFLENGDGSLENWVGRLKKHTVGGEPAGKVALILKTMGDRVDEPILELTETRLLLLDGDGVTKYDWRRVR